MTDPTPQTTPTRDEAVLNGIQISGRTLYKLDERGVNIWSANFQPNSGYSETEADKAAQAVFGALASAPAPASGGVDVVAGAQARAQKAARELDRMSLVIEGAARHSAPHLAKERDVQVKQLEWDDQGNWWGFYARSIVGVYNVCQSRAHTDGVRHTDWFVSYPDREELTLHPNEAEAKAAAQADYEARIRSALSPAATPVSEAGGEAWPAQSGGLNADWVAMVLAEDARIEDGKLANGPYLAVKIAEAADLPSEVSRLRGALANIRDHTRETSTATMALGALAKPASSPAGGDVEAAMKRAWLAVRGQPVGGGDGQTYIVPTLNNSVMREIVTAALSQSTSAGRVGE